MPRESGPPRREIPESEVFADEVLAGRDALSAEEIAVRLAVKKHPFQIPIAPGAEGDEALTRVAEACLIADQKKPIPSEELDAAAICALFGIPGAEEN